MHFKLQKIVEQLAESNGHMSDALVAHTKNGLPTHSTDIVGARMFYAQLELLSAIRKANNLLLDLEEQHRQNEFELHQEQKDYIADTTTPSIFGNPSWSSDAKVVEDVR